jgi:monoamine oxidase
MFDNSPPDGRPGILMGFVGGRQWATWSCRPQRERRAAVLRSFAKIAGPTALQPVDYLEHDWTAEAWTGGGPTAVAGPGLLTTLGPWRDRPHGRVRFAGAEHANHWNGYMDGAVRSGNDAAVALLEDGER